MSLLSEIVRGLTHPTKLLQRLYSEPREVGRRAIEGIRADILSVHNSYQRRLRNNTGVSIMEEDWDNLIILDGCRYDLFAECNTLDGELTKVVSPASTTKGFLRKSFGDSSFNDTVYVTANPNCYVLDAEFHHIEPLWEEYWDDSLDTVHPKHVADRTLELARRFPDKRFIIHFIQPHYPFIGETGKSIEHSSLLGGGLIADERTNPTIWDLLKKDQIEFETAWRAYRENLELSLPHVDRIIQEVGGKSVVTADHGNVFGRWGVYGHPDNVFLPELVEVPWFETEIGDRNEVTAGNKQKISSEESSLEEQLTALGYR